MGSSHHIHLLHRTPLCQKLPAEFEEKLIAFQQHVTGFHKTNKNIILIQTGNVDEKPLYMVCPESIQPINI